jgi:hypothetical protein
VPIKVEKMKVILEFTTGCKDDNIVREFPLELHYKVNLSHIIKIYKAVDMFIYYDDVYLKCTNRNKFIEVSNYLTELSLFDY